MGFAEGKYMKLYFRFYKACLKNVLIVDNSFYIRVIRLLNNKLTTGCHRLKSVNLSYDFHQKSLGNGVGFYFRRSENQI
ncbi:hypothetical protein SDC9_85686 [bioreactor metagenome]|uniref:Uncharacterized protein n=1 Tax=bioreactor metagenome TaxID=1076179 RepID=A0A644ZDU2_9ZZZZ